MSTTTSFLFVMDSSEKDDVNIRKHWNSVDSVDDDSHFDTEDCVELLVGCNCNGSLDGY